MVVTTSRGGKLRGELVQAEPTLDTGIELPAQSWRRLACDALILAAVLATTSQPLGHRAGLPGWSRSGSAAGPDPAGTEHCCAPPCCQVPLQRGVQGPITSSTGGDGWTNRTQQTFLACFCLPLANHRLIHPHLEMASLKNQPRRAPSQLHPLPQGLGSPPGDRPPPTPPGGITPIQERHPRQPLRRPNGGQPSGTTRTPLLIPGYIECGAKPLVSGNVPLVLQSRRLG